MNRRSEILEVAAIVLSAAAGHLLLVGLRSSDVAPPAAESYADESPAVTGSVIAFVSVEPRDRVVFVERPDGSRHLVETGGMVRLSSSDFDGVFEAPGYDGDIRLQFDVYRYGMRVSGGGIEARHPRLSLSGSNVRVSTR